MKRFFFWFFWLQIGMPFVVAMMFCATMILCGDFISLRIYDAPMMALVGVVVFSPAMGVNMLFVIPLIWRCRDSKKIRRLLFVDAAIIYAALWVFLQLDPGFGERRWRMIPAGIVWLAVSAVLARYVPMLEPQSGESE